MSKIVFLALQGAAVLIAAVTGWVMLGPKIYAIISLSMTLLIFALVVTSDARTAVSSNPNPDVILTPAPMTAWIIMSVAIAIALGAFWPLLPLALAVNKTSVRISAKADAARGGESNDARRL